MATEVRRTTCNRDCPDACGMLVETRDNEVVALRGDPDHPVTRGFLCFRTSRFPELQPQRLTTPLVRVGDTLEPASLDAALDLVAERLARIREESGPAAIFHYRSGGSLGMLKTVADRFFEAFGPCTTKIGDICNGAGEHAQLRDFGRSDSNDLFDLLHSRHVVLWGKNPFVSNVHLIPVLNDAKARGASCVLIDPVRHRGTALADVYVQPRPGADLELALGVARALLDGGRADGASCANFDAFAALARSASVGEWAACADVEPDVVEDLARRFADGPTAIVVGWGMQRRRRGGAIVRAIDALSAISGNLHRRGGGCSFYFQRRAAFAPLADGSAARHVREPLFGEDVLAAQDPPIRALWVTAGNPVAMLPDARRVAEAVESREFVVVVDPFLTDTGRRADVVLPVPTLLEDDDLLGAYGHHWIAESRPALAPPPEVVHEVVLFQRLAARLGLGDELAGSIDDWKRRLLANVAPQGVTLERLREEGAVRAPGVPEVTFADGRVATASGAVELIDTIDEPVADDPEYPLWLFSSSTRDAQSSTWSRDPGPRLEVTVHPIVAATAGLAAGDAAVLESRLGALDVVVAVADGQREDVAIVPKGGHLDRGQSANALIAAHPTDLGLGAAYLDCQVRLRRA